MRKSHTLPIFMGLSAIFLSASTALYYIFTASWGNAIPFMICAALLFAAQNQMHVQIGRAAPRHPLRWHLFVILGCDAVWCTLFLVRYMAELVPNQIKLGLRLHFIAFSLIHLAVLARYLITAHLMTKKAAAAAYTQQLESIEGR